MRPRAVVAGITLVVAFVATIACALWFVGTVFWLAIKHYDWALLRPLIGLVVSISAMLLSHHIYAKESTKKIG